MKKLELICKGIEIVLRRDGKARINNLSLTEIYKLRESFIDVYDARVNIENGEYVLSVKRRTQNA